MKILGNTKKVQFLSEKGGYMELVKSLENCEKDKENIKKAEKSLRDKITILEGVPGNSIKLFWNRMECMHSDYCERKKQENIKYCSFNPKMFECPAYQKYKRVEAFFKSEFLEISNNLEKSFKFIVS